MTLACAQKCDRSHVCGQNFTGQRSLVTQASNPQQHTQNFINKIIQDKKRLNGLTGHLSLYPSYLKAGFLPLAVSNNYVTNTPTSMFKTTSLYILHKSIEHFGSFLWCHLGSLRHIQAVTGWVDRTVNLVGTHLHA